MKPTFIAFAIAFAALAISASAEARKKDKSVFGQVTRAVRPFVPPGTGVLIDVVSGKPLPKAVGDTASDRIRVMLTVPKAVSAIDVVVEDRIKKAVGSDMARAIEIVRLPQKIQQSTNIAAVEAVADIAKNQNVDVSRIASIPLAALIQQAIDLYKGRAKPVPEGIKVLLATTFTEETLNNARFVIDRNLGSLPGAINFLKESAGGNHAVTVGNIIVFAHDPGLENVGFWAHEIKHTEQYARLTVPGFAAKYATSYRELEREADEVRRKAEVEAEIILRFINTKLASRS